MKNPTDTPPPVASQPGRSRWHSGLRTSFPLLVMAAITAAISYQHAYDVVGSVGGNSTMVAILLPVVPDLAVFMSYRVRRAGTDGKALATVIMWAGIAVTVALNVAAGRGHGWPAGCLNALAPLALVGSLHLMTRRRAKDAPGSPVDEEEHAGHCPHGDVSTVQDMARLIYEHSKDHTAAPLPQRAIAEALKASRNHLFPPAPAGPPLPPLARLNGSPLPPTEPRI